MTFRDVLSARDPAGLPALLWSLCLIFSRTLGCLPCSLREIISPLDTGRREGAFTVPTRRFLPETLCSSGVQEALTPHVLKPEFASLVPEFSDDISHALAR